MTFRLGSCVVLLGAVVSNAFGAAPVRTSHPEPPPLPLAVDLRKVPVGSWSEYRIAEGRRSTKVRMALVARRGLLADIETQVRAASVSAITRIMRMSVPIDDAPEVTPKERVIQLGEDPPMSIPAETPGAPAQGFRKLDPKKRVAVETITVPAGVFRRAEHYRDEGVGGRTFDFWISKTVMPFGLLKMISSEPAGASVITLELTGHGAGAKPLITSPPRPFDAAAIMNPGQIGGGTIAGHETEGVNGPSPRLVPSPHPGMPPMPAMVAPPGRAVNPPSSRALLAGAGGRWPESGVTTVKGSER